MEEPIVKPIFSIPMLVNNIDYDYEIPSSKTFEDDYNPNSPKGPNCIEIKEPDLEELILEQGKIITRESGFVDQPMQITQMWLNKYDESRPHLPMHYHQNCAWTGTWYPEDASHTIQFLNPNAASQNMHLPEKEFETDINIDFAVFRCQKGQVIIHPSWLGHSVYWDGKKPSYSISFDIAYKLPIGNKEYGSYNDGQ